MHISEEDENVGITGEITIANPPPRPIAEAGSSVGASTISDEVVNFFKEFDKRTPNPHPERHFWEFNGLLVSFGNFWVLSDCVPYLQRLTVEHGNFVTNFKLNAGLGGPMLSRISWKSGLTWDL